MTSPLPFSSPSAESGSSMKRALLILPTLALAAAGCAAEASSPDTPTTERVLESTTVTPKPAAEPGGVTGHAISAVAAEEGTVISPSMADEYAQIICEGLDDGLHPLALVAIGVEALPRYDEGEHAFLVGASIGAECPEHMSILDGAL